MIAALVLAAGVAGQPAGLEPAQAAFARGDYPAAEQLALEAPPSGAALYLAGLARFRTGRYAEALDALEQAGRAADAPEPVAWHYNQGACLYELGRFEEAEREYLAAAQGSLAAVSLINAGFAALDRGDRGRARELAAQARAVASAHAAELVADLEAHIAGSELEQATQAYQEGLTFFDAGQYAQARDKFHAAAQLDPKDARARIMSGASALRLGQRSDARDELQGALDLPLDAADAEAARGYLELLSHGLASRNTGLEGSVRLGSGYDSDALQTGLFAPDERSNTGATATPSALGAATLDVALRGHPREGLASELAYGFDQLAYAATAAQDRSVQQHSLSGSLELTLRPDLHLGGVLGGQLAFTGLANFRGLQAAGTAGAWLAFDETAQTFTRLELSASPRRGLGDEFSYLTGTRAEALLTQELWHGPFAFDAGYRLRLEDIGSALESAPAPGRECGPGCTAQATVPFGYLGNTFWGAARGSLGARFSFEVSGGLELRDYLSDTFVTVTRLDGATAQLDRHRRHDDRWFGAATASFSLTQKLSLTLRYDLVLNRSSEGGDRAGACGSDDCRGLDPENRTYDKHAVTLGTQLNF